MGRNEGSVGEGKRWRDGSVRISGECSDYVLCYLTFFATFDRIIECLPAHVGAL